MKIFLVIIGFSLSAVCFAQKKTELYQGIWKGQLHRQDGKIVAFNFEVRKAKNSWSFVIRNAAERIPLKTLLVKDDSVNFALPVFESEFHTKLQPDGSLKGTWFKGTATQTQQWVFTAIPNKSNRFEPVQGAARENVSGRWSLLLNRANGGARPAIAELNQKVSQVTGTVLTPSGDYRYMEGIVTGNLFELSVFDGAHAFYFSGTVDVPGRMSGNFYSGYAGVESWKAEKDAKAVLPEIGNIPIIKEGQPPLGFTFRDIDRDMVSFTDARFKNKVVVIQIMGSWCPNCLDETKFLSEYYNRNKNNGVEVIALAYEYSTDFERSRATLNKFRELYKVQYPMLVTGVWVNDSLRTEKTIPQISPIKAFPTTIFVGRDGKIKKVEAGYYGPGTGIHHEAYKKEFETTISKLLKNEELEN